MTKLILLDEILELNASHIHIRNKDELLNKINTLISGGSESLQIVSDYDMTLTKQHENGKKHVTSFGMIQKCKSITESYITGECELYQKYRAIEVDPFVKTEDKMKHMEDWWLASEQLLKDIVLPKHEFDDVARLCNPSLRDGTFELFHDLNKAQVPVLVFSAGLGDSVEAVLRHNKVLYPNVKIVSNYLDYDENERIRGYRGKMITVMNKNEHILEGSDYYNLVKTRPNVLLMGDHLGDSGMADGVPNCNAIIKIGFLYERAEECLPKFLDAFDIVLIDDQTMNVPRALLKLVLQ